jgi:membrane complex biogenesis BtpA family protein
MSQHPELRGPGLLEMVGGLIGVVHLPAMPGDPSHAGETGFGALVDAALTDAVAYHEGGIDGLIVENFGSVPFAKGTKGDRLPPHQLAAMALVCHRVASETGLPVGVNCLRNDAQAALAIAAVCELAFVRVNVHVGAYVCDQGVIEGEAAMSLRYRQQLGAKRVRILADVLVKHAAPLAPISATQATRDTLERGLADAVIVSGCATGSAVDEDILAEVIAAARGKPVLLGSGLTEQNASILAPYAQGAIVGTACKRDGIVSAPVERERVERLVGKVKGLWAS